MEAKFIVLFSCCIVLCAGYGSYAPKCHGQNEFLSECSNGCDPINCPKSLKAEQERLASCVSMAVCLPPACRCRPDYRRDKEGRCIHIGECPGICPINEEFSSCTQAICRAQNCTQKGKSIACPDISEGSCERGCVCSTGYLRDERGNCVPDDQCPGPQQPQCRVNEVLSCVHECPPERTCRNRGIQFRCREPTKQCEKKCICKPGYYKNYLGDCITGKQCDQCSGPNEFFSCGSACDNECRTRDTQNRTNCPIINIVCNPRCYCKDGYARNESNQCIPVDQCPKPANLCCGPNEEYVTCKKTCPPEVCFSMVAKFKCPGNPQCVPGCACKPGFLRKKNGSQCVPICDCSEMKSSPDCKKRWPNSN